MRGSPVSQAWAQQQYSGVQTLVSHTDEVDLGVEEDQKKQRGRGGMINGI